MGERVLKIIFKGDTRDLDAAFARVESKARGLVSAFDHLNGHAAQSGGGSTLRNAFDYTGRGGSASAYDREALRAAVEASKSLQNIDLQATRSATHRNQTELRAANEVARINAETARQAVQQEKLREQAARQLSQVKIQEQRRAADDFLRLLKDEQAVDRRAKQEQSAAAKEAARAAAQASRQELIEAQTVARERARTAQQSALFESQRAAAAERVSREQIRTDALTARERERLLRASVQTSAQADRERIRTSSLAAREFEKQEREKLKTAQATARAASREYENNLGPGFFSKLGRAATSGFRDGFKIGGETFGGGGILSGAMAVLTGNILTSLLGSVKDKITGGVKVGFDYNRLKESLLLGYERKLGSATAADNFFRLISGFAYEESPLTVAQAQSQTNRLLALNFKPQEVIPLLRAAGDAAAGLGKVGVEAQEKIESITLALGQMRLKQKVNAEEMSRQLVEAGVDAWGYVADALQKQYPEFAQMTRERVISEAQKLAEANMLDADAVVTAIVQGMMRQFGGLGKDINWRTVAGRESMLEDRFQILSGLGTESSFTEYGRGLEKLITLLNSGAAERVAGGISATTGGIYDGLESVLQAVSTGNLKPLGLDAVSGYAQGITDGAGLAVDAGRGVVQQVYGAIKAEQKSNSPSLLFMELGLFAGQGYVIGFQQGVKGFKRVVDNQMGDAERLLSEKASRQRERLERAAESDVVRAFFEAIRRAEGGRPNVMAGGRAINSGALHPGEVVPRSEWFVGPEGPSSAAGNWQITRSNWRRYAQQVGATNFSDVNDQLRVALILLDEAGGLTKLLAGDINGAIRAAGKHWAGVPGSPLPGREASLASFMRWFEQGANTQGNAVPVSIVQDQTRQGDFERISREVFGRVLTPEQVLGIGDWWPGAKRGPGGVVRIPGEEEWARGMLGADTPLGRRLRPPTQPHKVGEMTGMGLIDLSKSNERGFLEWLYGQYTRSDGGMPTPLSEANARHAALLKAEEFGIGATFMRVAETMVQERIALEQLAREIIGARAAANGGSLPAAANVGSPPAPASIDEIIDRYRNQPLLTEAGKLGTTIIPKSLESVKTFALESEEAFSKLPPLIKKSAIEAEQAKKRFEQLAEELSDAFGSSLERALRLDFKGAALGLISDLRSIWIGQIRDEFQRMFKKGMMRGGGMATVLTGEGSGGGFSLGNLFGNLLGGLFNRRASGSGGAMGPGGTPNWNPRVGGGFGFGLPSAAAMAAAGFNIPGVTPPPGGGAAGQVLSASFARRMFPDLFDGGMTPPVSLYDQGVHRSLVDSAVNGVGGPAARAAMAGRFSLAGLGASVAPMLPLLGLGLGASLGGGSRLGSVMGGIGGLLLGGAGMVGLGGLLAGGAGAGAVSGGIGGALGGLGAGGGIGGGLGGALAGFFTNPFTIGIGAALLVGAFIVGRNQRRREEEKLRTAAWNEFYTAAQELISGVRSDRLDGAGALSRLDQLRAQYVQKASQLKDSKTRRIALKTMDDNYPYIRRDLQRAIDEQASRRKNYDAFVPTFKDGGRVGLSMPEIRGVLEAPRFADGGITLRQFSGRVPGLYDRRDDKLIRVSGDEVVLTPDQWKPIQPYLAKKKVPGFKDGGAQSDVSFAGGFGGASDAGERIAGAVKEALRGMEVVIEATNEVSLDGKVVDETLTRSKGRIVGIMRAHVQDTRRDGFAGDIEEVLSPNR